MGANAIVGCAFGKTVLAAIYGKAFRDGIKQGLKLILLKSKGVF
jgi:hypothetical protein